MLEGQVLAATSSSDNTTFSVPILVGAAALAVGWVLLLLVVAAWRRPPGIRSGPATQDLPPVPPAVAGLLCNDFELPAELPPATLLDLAARRVVRLEEVEPGKTICRLRGGADDQSLAPYERRVLDEVRRKAVDGVVPTDALTTGPEAASSGWHRAFSREVIADAQGRGLARPRWPGWLVTIIGAGPLPVGALLYLSGAVGGESDDAVVLSVAAGAIAVAGIVLLVVAAGRFGRSLAQLPTHAGRETTALCLALRKHLRENEQLADLQPAAVQLWGRHFAYAGAMGVAPTAVSLLPFGAEDDNGAWSRFGGQWHRVRVRYPRGWPPGWGKHPAFATFLAVLWGAGAVAAIYGLTRLAQWAHEPITSSDSSFSRDQLDWIGRGALLLTIPLALVVLWALYVLVRAVPDFWLRRTSAGDLVRARARRQIFQWNSDMPNHWYYFALDDGARRRIRSWRVRRELYDAHSQGDTITAVYTPNLGYVREIGATSG
ncbi:MAG TPA: hypothetical protein VFA62_05590 [Acidimicrobiia bacterium]|nr:hypothetical protein [Acidimicrobiia bacterium]